MLAFSLFHALCVPRYTQNYTQRAKQVITKHSQKANSITFAWLDPGTQVLEHETQPISGAGIPAPFSLQKRHFYVPLYPSDSTSSLQLPGGCLETLTGGEPGHLLSPGSTGLKSGAGRGLPGFSYLTVRFSSSNELVLPPTNSFRPTNLAGMAVRRVHRPGEPPHPSRTQRLSRCPVKTRRVVHWSTIKLGVVHFHGCWRSSNLRRWAEFGAPRGSHPKDHKQELESDLFGVCK